MQNKDIDKYLFKRILLNERFQEGLVNPVALGSSSFLSIKGDNAEKFLVKTEPKWLRELVNKDTGEVYYATDFTTAYRRKCDAVNRFVSFYAAAYQKRVITLLFHTFTAVNLSNYDGIRRVIDAIKYRYESIQRPILGYIWVLECSRNFHVHYHMATAINRLNVKRIPEELKLEGLWGARTGVEFVRGDLKTYMQKKALGSYITKHAHFWERYQVRRDKGEGKLGVMRMYGLSKTFSLPIAC